ncbi:hypothetical protein D3C87_1713470 [compost metagenome]
MFDLSCTALSLLVTVVHCAHYLMSTTLQPLNHQAHLLDGVLCSLCQPSHFIGNNRETPTGIPGARGLDGGVQR